MNCINFIQLLIDSYNWKTKEISKKSSKYIDFLGSDNQ